LDPDRTLYTASGMTRADLWALLRPSVVWRYLQLLARGRRLRRPGRDVSQLGGDVLIDPAGMVRLHHISTGPEDRPSVESILAAAVARS
jgi:hypothetical protein